MAFLQTPLLFEGLTGLYLDRASDLTELPGRAWNVRSGAGVGQ